jgi:hypothetical protein
LRLVSEHADYELRVDSGRVSYRVAGETVTVELIAQKKGNVLLIEGREFQAVKIESLGEVKANPRCRPCPVPIDLQGLYRALPDIQRYG